MHHIGPSGPSRPRSLGAERPKDFFWYSWKWVAYTLQVSAEKDWIFLAFSEMGSVYAEMGSVYAILGNG